MDALIEFLYVVGLGLFFSYLLMVIYVSIWEDDDDE